MNSSSTIQAQISPSSSTSPNELQGWQKHIEASIKPQTPSQIKAAGEVKVKIGVLWLVGVTCSILAFFGGIIFITDPNNAKDIWVIISPIISAGVTGTVAAFLAGEKSGSGE